MGEEKFQEMTPQDKIEIMSNTINQIHTEYGCNFNWKDSLTVLYKGKDHEIYKNVREIVTSCIIGDEMDAIDFSTSGIDFDRACKDSSRFLVNEIIEKERKSS